MTSHQSPFISLPPKTTTETDFATPIRQAIGQVYGERPDGYTEDIENLSRCRNDAVKGAGSDATARDLLFKYFGQLELLELRFAETKISFLWNDAYTTKPTTQTSLAFEKASILHLLSSVLSHLAATSPRSSPEGIKRAYAALRQSTGLLNFINENFLHAPSTDLSREVVSLAGKTMITQAGETFVEKCISEKKPATLVCKMCQSVAAGYASLFEDSKDFQGKGILDRNWVSVYGIKAKYFASLAQWYRAGVDMDKGDHGAGLVRYEIADKLAVEAHKLAKEFNYTYSPLTQNSSSSYTSSITWSEETPSYATLPSDAATALLEITKSHQVITTEARTSSRNDNDLVYHALPPSESSLPVIDPLPAAGLAAPITIQEIYAQASVSSLIGPDIFRRLVPLEVHEKASVYSEEKAKLVRAEQERCDQSEGETRAALEDLKIRERINRFKAIIQENSDDYSKQRGVSREIATCSEEMRGVERRDGPVEDVLRRVEDRRNRLEADLRDLTRELDEESRECESQRAKFGHLWTQSPSSSSNRQYKSDCKSHTESLQSAASSDRSIFQRWNTLRADIDTLRGSSQVIERVYADADAGRESAASINLLDVDVAQEELAEREKDQLRDVIAELEERLGRLEKIRRERDEVMKDLKEKIQADDVSHLLLLNRRTQGVEPTLFASELAKFSPYQNRISVALGSQSELLDEMAMLAKQAESASGVRQAQRKIDQAEGRRGELDRRFRAAFEGYMDIRSDLDKGSHFYNSLATLVDSLRRGIRSFVNSRAQERNRMIASAESQSHSHASPLANNGSRSLEDTLAGMSLGGRGGNGSYPPVSSPPPPSQSPYHTNTFAASSPPPPSQKVNSSNPYDFASFGNLPSAFDSRPPPSVAPSRSSALPPPPPKPSSYATYGLPPPQSQSAYQTTPPTQRYGVQQVPSPYPPSPARYQPAAGSPTYQQTTQPSNPAYNPYPSYAPPATSQNSPSTYQSPHQTSYPSYSGAGYPAQSPYSTPGSGMLPLPPPPQPPYGDYGQQQNARRY